ncbi:MAG: EthD domain-containing protein [Pseudomonadota bacterium]
MNPLRKVCVFYRGGPHPALPALPGALRQKGVVLSHQQLTSAAAPYDGALEWWFADVVPPEAARTALATQLADVHIVGYYRGLEHLIMPATAHAQAQGFMKSVFTFRHNPAMSFAEFSRYWREEHAPIVPRTPHLAGYAQIHLDTQCTYSASAPEFSAVTELYWSDHAALKAGMNSREMTQEQSRDAEVFADRDSIRMAVVEPAQGVPL